MPDPVVLSASSLQTYLRCGHQWYLAYVVRLKRPPNVRQVIGLAAHTAVEHNFAQKIESKIDVPTDEMVEVFSDNFDSLAVDIEDPDEPLGSAKDSGVKLVKVHAREVSPAIQPVWVEKAGQFTINDQPYSWTVDLVDDRDRVRDTKTKARAPKIEDFMLQMTGYALGFRQETGRVESDVVIDALVRTKVPYYLPLYGGQVNDNRIQSFASVVGSVGRSIENGDFIPNGLTNGACSWCGYADICKYRKR